MKLHPIKYAIILFSFSSFAFAQQCGQGTNNSPSNSNQGARAAITSCSCPTSNGTSMQYSLLYNLTPSLTACLCFALSAGSGGTGQYIFETPSVTCSGPATFISGTSRDYQVGNVIAGLQESTCWHCNSGMNCTGNGPQCTG